MGAVRHRGGSAVADLSLSVPLARRQGKWTLAPSRLIDSCEAWANGGAHLNYIRRRGQIDGMGDADAPSRTCRPRRGGGGGGQ